MINKTIIIITIIHKVHKNRTAMLVDAISW